MIIQNFQQKVPKVWILPALISHFVGQPLSREISYVLGCADKDETGSFSLSGDILDIFSGDPVIFPTFSQVSLFWILPSGSSPPFLICSPVSWKLSEFFTGRGLQRALSIGADAFCTSISRGGEER
jgi:hypothetical protein